MFFGGYLCQTISVIVSTVMCSIGQYIQVIRHPWDPVVFSNVLYLTASSILFVSFFTPGAYFISHTAY